MRLARSGLDTAIGSLAAALVAQFSAAVYVATNDGFGRGDLAGYAYWNLLFAGYLFAVGTILRPRVRLARRGARLGSWLVIGATAGFVWTWIVAGALGPSILAFSFPVLYLWTAAGAIGGVVMSLRAEPEVPSRGRPWLVLLVPPVALICVVLLNWILLLGSRYLWNRAEPEVFTFPDGFTGQAYIVHDSSNLHRVPSIGGARKYVFDSTGIYVTGSEPVQGWLNQRFYYRRGDGAQSPITARWDATIHDTPENRRDTTVGIYFLRSGERIERGCRVRYTSFFVGRKSDVLKERGVDELEQYVATQCAKVSEG